MEAPVRLCSETARAVATPPLPCGVNIPRTSHGANTCSELAAGPDSARQAVFL